MTTVTSTPNRTAPSGTAPRSLLSGMPWLVWRQHRAAFLTMLAITAAALVWIGYQRGQMTDYLSGYGWPHSLSDEWRNDFQQQGGQWLDATGGALRVIPVLLGVFIGAPLFAQDIEQGTAKLIASQSAGRTRWLATKLGMTALVLVICTTVLSIAFAWWWGPVRTETAFAITWTSGTAFDVTGPVPVALTLFTVAGGMAIGVLLRRTLISMVVTFGFVIAVQGVWEYVRLALGDVVTVRTPGVDRDALASVPDGAYVLDHSYYTGSGRLLGWSTCQTEETEQAMDVCMRKADVVGWSVDYLPISQMPAMQWLGAAILLALTGAITAFVFFWGRKRLV
ncbi:ABC transporter [Streptomyces sp. NPDC059862]|uniref:ABC transporter n=1 Tax=Streptomyces sp. NPDC059862 TaxID=3346975 RepID=UPI003660428D